MRVKEPTPLADLRVVDTSTWIAGAYACRLLADAGAEVVRVEPEGGHPLRAWSASRSAVGSDGGPLWRHLTDGHDTTGPDGLDAALASADAGIWSPGGPSTPAEMLAAHPHLTVVAITPFGLDGPWTDRPATELTLQALSGGIIGLGRGDPERPPVHVGGQVGEWLAGAWAAVALLTAGRTDAPGIVDLSMLEVQAMCLTYYPVTYHDVCGRPMRKRRALTVPGVARASDAVVGLGVGTGQQWLDFCAMTGHPEWTEDASLFTERGALAEQIDEWVGAQTAAEVLEIATAFRIPNAPIVDGANAPGVEHLRERGSFTMEPDGMIRPRPPVRLTSGPTPAVPPPPRQPGPLPFSGLRVLDMTAYWAGPSASHLLALLGAEVIHVEAANRPDGARAIGVHPKADHKAERGPIFAALNTNKQSIAVDLGTDAGMDVLRRLVPTCDVVIENFTPRVFDNLGLSYESLRALRDDLIVVRMPGFGLDGPWRDNAAFAFVVEDASGLTWMTGHPDANPVEPYCVGDSNAGLHAAFGLLLALAQRDRTGAGGLVEAAMIDAALSVAAEQVVEHSATGVRLGRDGNRGPGQVLQNVYECRRSDLELDETDENDESGEPDRVAIAVTTDEQWAVLVKALGEPDWAGDEQLATAAGRRTQQDRIDAELGAWCAARTVADVVDTLLAAGVPVAPVRQPHEQPDLVPMRHRGFFEEVDHPVIGTVRYSTLPFLFPGRPERLHCRHAPLLGEHTADVLRGLGVDDAELKTLEADGVIPTEPSRTP